jgi:hypothetical protein
MEGYTREQKLIYYFWLDDLIISHWSEYLDLKLDEDNDCEEECKAKLDLIDFYQKILDDVGEPFTFKELNAWYCEKYGKPPDFIRFCKSK